MGNIIIRYIVGFVGASLMIILLRLLDKYVFLFTINDFFIGWLSCMCYYASIEIYDNYNNNK